MNKILKTLKAWKNKNETSFFDSSLVKNNRLNVFDTGNFQFSLENELKISKSYLQEYKIKYSDIFERFSNISNFECPQFPLFDEDIYSEKRFSDNLLLNSTNDISNILTSLPVSDVELEDHDLFAVLEHDNYGFPAITDLNGIVVIEDESQFEYLYQLSELYDLAVKIKRSQYNEARLTNLLYNVLKKSWVCLIDIRMVFRRIIRFLFKNLDDEHVSFINIYRVNKIYQPSLNFA